MQVTIDSAEPLEKVLPVVAALYGIELTVTPREAVPGRARSASPAPKAPDHGEAGMRRKMLLPELGAVVLVAQAAPKPDPLAVRRWARANKYAVKDFGRVPAAVTAAYIEDAAPAS